MECIVENDRPYYPKLRANAESNDSIAMVAATVSLGLTDETQIDAVASKLSVQKVTGGITNALYCVSGFKDEPSKNKYFDSSCRNSALLRIFGAEGMINRDVETAYYAQLCDADIAHEFVGRFGNGRVEGWLDGYRPLMVDELSQPDNSKQIAQQLAKLHTQFHPSGSNKEAGMWDQLNSWMKQSLDNEKYPFKNGRKDEERANALFDLKELQKELNDCQTNGSIPLDAKVVFCHNDLLAANIMINPQTRDIQLIDFEYGGYNFAAFDIANHFNEWAGGTDNGKPIYSKFPTREQREFFLQSYLGPGTSPNTLHALLAEVDAFVLVNHLYWGLWAVNQAKAEGCLGFDYLLYASNRIKRFYEHLWLTFRSWI